jgi:hypothetical protein
LSGGGVSISAIVKCLEFKSIQECSFGFGQQNSVFFFFFLSFCSSPYMWVGCFPHLLIYCWFVDLLILLDFIYICNLSVYWMPVLIAGCEGFMSPVIHWSSLVYDSTCNSLDFYFFVGTMLSPMFLTLMEFSTSQLSLNCHFSIHWWATISCKICDGCLLMQLNQMSSQQKVKKSPWNVMSAILKMWVFTPCIPKGYFKL